MIPSLLLLSASVVASPVIVSEVKATREAGHLRVEVRGDGGIDPEVARTRIDQGNLYLFLSGTRVKADNRAWKLDEGVGEIRAHRHHTETELDVPLLGNGCSGPVELQGTSTGLTALVGCEGMPAAAPVHAAARVATASPKPVLAEKSAPAPKPAAAPAAAKEELAPAKEAAAPTVAKAEPKAATAAATEAAALKNLVALPPEDDDAADEKAAPRQEEKPVAEAAKAPVAPPARVEFKADVVDKKAPAPSLEALTPPADSSAKSPAGSSSSVAPSALRAVGLPALFLAALAVAAYVFARKKRVLGTRRIQILETASLGPKRSLVIARVGDETLVLGASEAGITLLQMGDGSAAKTAAAAPAASPVAAATLAQSIASTIKVDEDEGPSEMDQSLIDALADVPEPDSIVPTPARGSFRSIEGGLASLFGRKAAANAAARVEPKGGATFDDVLEDSVEDQELRRKLAAGMSARVR